MTMISITNSIRCNNSLSRSLLDLRLESMTQNPFFEWAQRAHRYRRLPASTCSLFTLIGQHMYRRRPCADKNWATIENSPPRFSFFSFLHRLQPCETWRSLQLELGVRGRLFSFLLFRWIEASEKLRKNWFSTRKSQCKACEVSQWGSSKAFSCQTKSPETAVKRKNLPSRIVTLTLPPPSLLFLCESVSRIRIESERSKHRQSSIFVRALEIEAPNAPPLFASSFRAITQKCRPRCRVPTARRRRRSRRATLETRRAAKLFPPRWPPASRRRIESARESTNVSS